MTLLHQLKVGDRAPEFTLRNQEDKNVTPMALKGKRFLLSFHPLAWTPVCEIQMRTLEVRKYLFDELDVIAFGISVDSVSCKNAWAKAIGVRETNLLADFWPHGEVAQKYGLFMDDPGISKRANVLIGPDQTIELLRIYDIPQVPDIEEIIAHISSNPIAKSV